MKFKTEDIFGYEDGYGYGEGYWKFLWSNEGQTEYFDDHYYDIGKTDGYGYTEAREEIYVPYADFQSTHGTSNGYGYGCGCDIFNF